MIGVDIAGHVRCDECKATLDLWRGQWLGHSKSCSLWGSGLIPETSREKTDEEVQREADLARIDMEDRALRAMGGKP